MEINKVWLITGCSTGLGRAMAVYIANRGDQVVATVRKNSQIDELEALVPGKIKAILMDVSSPEQIQKGVTEILTEYDQIDVLVNNAGYGELGPIEQIGEHEVHRQFDVNVYGPLRLIRAVLPSMRAKRTGYVINITSIAGLRGSPGVGIYNASKFALEGLGEALALDVKHLGISVTNVEPGPFRTKWAGESASYVNDVEEDYTSSAGALMTVIQGKDGNQPGDPDKAAEAIYKLAQMENPPVHLPLGNVAFEVALANLDKLKEEILAFEHIGRQTDF